MNIEFGTEAGNSFSWNICFQLTVLCLYIDIEIKEKVANYERALCYKRRLAIIGLKGAD
jgi:hypothetical protein